MAAQSRSKSVATSKKRELRPTVYLEQSVFDRLKTYADAKGFKLTGISTRLIEIALDEVQKHPELVA